ncbi:MAG: pentapeptide repeat-containing protein [Deltaproteobacteria bacterium]|nr:pentapeptide repeat-containing protein [Deltaproteobacteria bacterium]
MAEEEKSKSESKEEQPKSERQFNQQQYDMLKRCSDAKNITEWNEWRDKNPYEKIRLQGNKLQYSNLQGADLEGANLQGAELWGANLQGGKIFYTHLQGAELGGTRLQGANFTGVIVNGSTSFLDCEIDEDTDFRDTGLENVRIMSGTKILLKYNVRRMNWEDWYEEHKRLKWLVRPFWWMSDYGISTGRVLLTFFILALFFAVIYSNCACWWPPGVVSDLAVEPHLPLWHYFVLVLLRPVYFSIVTMTTLGFGDMFAHDESVLGHLLLTIQVILGYVLLGALVTRLAVLFTSDGPAGSFTPMDKETKELLAKLKEDKSS